MFQIAVLGSAAVYSIYRHDDRAGSCKSFGTQALAGYSATMRVENVFSLIFVSIGNAVSPYVSQNLGANKPQRIKKGYHAALVLDVCFSVIAFIVIERSTRKFPRCFLVKTEQPWPIRYLGII